MYNWFVIRSMSITTLKSLGIVEKSYYIYTVTLWTYKIPYTISV